MKRLRTVNGVKHIQFFNRRDFEDKVQEAVTQHRATLIARLLGGLNEYMEYRFRMRVNEETAENIREKLMTLKHQAVPIEECQPVVDELLQKDLCVLSSAAHYETIDERIRYGLK
jgi:DNA phosphorothioation-dependent restriction protein DptG